MATLLENANRIKNDKEAIRKAIVAKGVNVATSAKLDDYAAQIGKIVVGSNTLNAYVATNLTVTVGGTAADSWSSSAWTATKPKDKDLTMTINIPSSPIIAPSDKSTIYYAVNLKFPYQSLRHARATNGANNAISHYYYYRNIMLTGNGDATNIGRTDFCLDSNYPQNQYWWNSYLRIYGTISTSGSSNYPNVIGAIEFTRITRQDPSVNGAYVDNIADYISVKANKTDVTADLIIVYP